ncbi:MAG: Paraquat-inducible protein, partial [Lacunisphaera sp.]|nr:Paraquat-inducible protein [Lacunisphaera sp.]
MTERGWLSREAALAFAVSGLLLSLSALLLPFVTLRQLGHVRTTFLTVGFSGFWSHGFSALGAWVLFCGTLAPIALLGLLTVILATHGRRNYSAWHRRSRHVADAIEYWARPEVQVLG